MSRGPAPISYEVFQQELEAARDAGQITQHDYEIGSEHMRKLLGSRARQGDLAKAGGALGAVGSLYYARRYRRVPLAWPATGMLVTGTAILSSFLPLVPKLYQEASFVQSLDNANDFQRAVIRALKVASLPTQVIDPDALPGPSPPWQEPNASGAGQSSWDAIRRGQHPPQQQQQSSTPVQDALAERRRQQQQQQQPQQEAATANNQPQSRDEELEKERREWEAMMAKERELAQGK